MSDVPADSSDVPAASGGGYSAPGRSARGCSAQGDSAPRLDLELPRPGRSALYAGAVSLALVLAIAWLPGARATPWPSTGLWAAAFAAYVVAATSHDRRPVGRRGLWTLAILGRLALLPLEPHFSDDVYRYMWDGWVQLHGLNPYLYAPDSAILEPLRPAWHSLINHPSVPTIYPPGAQLVFWALALPGPAVLLFKAAWLAADLGVGLVLERLASRRGESPGLAPLLYLWSPLVLLEVAWSGHMEPLGLLPMLVALLFLGRRRGRLAATGGALLGFGAAVKLAPAAAIPAAARWRRISAAAASGTLLLLFLPYAGAGTSMFRGLLTYAAQWEFHAGLYRALASLAGAPAAKALGGGAVLVCALWAAWRRWSVERALYWTIGTALLLSPTLHPWYVLWILPLASLRRGRAWLLLSGTIFLAYWGLDAYRASGIWPEPLVVRFAIHGPVLALLAAEALAQRGPRRRQVA